MLQTALIPWDLTLAAAEQATPETVRPVLISMNVSRAIIAPPQQLSARTTQVRFLANAMLGTVVMGFSALKSTNATQASIAAILSLGYVPMS